MSRDLYQTIQAIVRDELARVRNAEIAVVQETHTEESDNYACTVVLRNSGLVLEKVPMATGRLGLVAVPPAGSPVLVQFVGGQLNAPVITGALYSDEHRPPTYADNQALLHLPHDADDAEAVRAEVLAGDERAVNLRIGDALKLELRDDDPVVSLDVGDGKATLTIAADGALAIDVQGDLNLNATGDLGLSAQNLALKATGVTIEADGEMALKGAVINLN